MGTALVSELLNVGGQDHLVSLLQESLAEAEAWLVHHFEVRVIAIIGIFDNELFLWIMAPKQLNVSFAVFNLITFSIKSLRLLSSIHSI